MRPSLAAVASGLLLASALFPLPRASANKYMVMGESLELLLADMLLSGDISSAQQSQIHVFLLRGDSVAEISTPGSEPRGHAATGLPAMTISDTSDLRSYLDSELESGSLGSAAAEYLHALLNLDADVAGLPTSPVVNLHNQYAGNGNVELLGRIDINPPQNGDLYNGIWGYNSESREYAFQCHSDGLYILDVTDPAAAYGVQFIPMPGGRTWRDVDVHTHSGTGVPYGTCVHATRHGPSSTPAAWAGPGARSFYGQHFPGRNVIAQIWPGATKLNLLYVYFSTSLVPLRPEHMTLTHYSLYRRRPPHP